MAKSEVKARIGTISLWTCTAIVIANMVGTGVFASIGYQVPGLPSGFPIMFLWALGGMAAFCGALSYAELASAIPRSGGEYHFLSRVYHPALGTMAGMVSATVGFSAPIALASFLFGKHASVIFPADVNLMAASVAFLVSTAHLITRRVSGVFQNVFTLLKLGLILVLIVAGLFFAEHQDITLLPKPGDSALIWSSGFAVCLAYVSFSYTGWNAATYIMDEVKDPQRTVTRALLIGTLTVTVLYLLINAVFLKVTPLPELASAGEAGAYKAAEHIFGVEGGKVVAGVICLGLIATISAMTWAGPRVLQTMSEDLPILNPLGQRNDRGIPARAIVFQLLIVMLMIFTGTFQSVLIYIQCLLMLCASVTVAGVIVLRLREPNLPRPFKCWAYPLTPLFFVGVESWGLYFMIKEHPKETGLGALTLLAGLALYFFGRPKLAR